MSLQRIIILQSVQDDLTEFREFRMESNPVLKAYKFLHTYAIELTDEEKRLPMFSMMNKVKACKFNSADFEQRLDKLFLDFNPDAFIIHKGFVFDQFTDVIIRTLISLKLKYPKVRFTIEYAKQMISQNPSLSQIFVDDVELKIIIENIF
jgi:hypothetical protein